MLPYNGVKHVSRLNARTRWAVPAGALAVVGIVAAATAVADASVPSLPARTAAQLIAEVNQAVSKSLGPFTATVQETANLGLPQLPQVAQSGGTANLTSGTQTVNIWYSDPQHVRIAHPVPDGESDLRLNGRTLWLWNSKTQTATKITLPANATGVPGQAGNGAMGGTCPPPSPSSACATLTPQAAASQVLKALGPSTVVAVESNVKAPTGPAYQLALEPRTSQSLIGKVVIAIDAKTHLPVSVDVFGRGSAGLVYSVGFSSLNFGAPAASNFTFTPPPGATVKTQTVPSSIPSVLKQSGLSPASLNGLIPGGVAVHQGFSSATGLMPAKSAQGPVVPIPKQAFATINAKFGASLPASMSKAQRAAAIKAFDAHFKVTSGLSPTNSVVFRASNSVGPLNAPASTAGRGQKVIGTAWLSVVATPANPQIAAAVQALLSGRGSALRAPSTSSGLFGSSSSSASSSPAYSSSLSVQGGQDLAVLRALLLATTPVHGSWGSGRLLQTKVVSVLITSKGQILIGAVAPAVLYADVPAAG
jgi:outer membrane lipoprotein-sorting protein